MTFCDMCNVVMSLKLFFLANASLWGSIISVFVCSSRFKTKRYLMEAFVNRVTPLMINDMETKLSRIIKSHKKEKLICWWRNCFSHLVVKGHNITSRNLLSGSDKERGRAKRIHNTVFTIVYHKSSCSICWLCICMNAILSSLFIDHKNNKNTRGQTMGKSEENKLKNCLYVAVYEPERKEIKRLLS